MNRATRAKAFEALRELMTFDPQQYTCELSDEALTTLIESDVLLDESEDSDEPTSMIRAPVSPRPHLNSGAIALPEPDE